MLKTIWAEIIYAGDLLLASYRSFACVNGMTKWEIPGQTLKWSPHGTPWVHLKGREATLVEEASGSTGGFLLCYPGFYLLAVCLIQFSHHTCEQAYSFPFILETQRCQVSRRPCSHLSHVSTPVMALDGIWDGFPNSRERVSEWQGHI